MIFLYQVGIRFYYLGILIASLFNRKARLWLSGRKNAFKDLKGRVSELRTPNSRLVWFHCSSLGEFEQARPLMEYYKPAVGSRQSAETAPRILITFFSPSGYEIRKNYEGADLVCYLPLDTKSHAEKFISLINPSQVFFVKYDFWYNYLSTLSKKNIPTYLVSANFRQEQFKGTYGNYLKTVLKFFRRIFVQNESSQKILSENGIHNVTVSGDLRFDRVAQTAATAKKIQLVEHFKGSARVMVCGSTWEKDEDIISRQSAVGSRQEQPHSKMIIAPHEINEARIHSLILSFPHSLILRYSEISKEPVSSALDKLQKANVLIIDNIGMLSSLYQYADIAYIGGGFGAGIHNTLEAVAFGVPVIFGPNHHKFPEAQELIDQGGGFCIRNEDEFKKVMNLFASDEKILKMASMVCKNFVSQRKGAVERILEKT